MCNSKSFNHVQRSVLGSECLEVAGSGSFQGLLLQSTRKYHLSVKHVDACSKNVSLLEGLSKGH